MTFFGWIVLVSVFVVVANGQNWSINDILPQGYNPKSPPVPNGVTNVNMSITVNDLLAVTESDSSFQLDLTLKLKWFENRLNLSQQIIELIKDRNNTIDNLILDSSFVPKFWIPDVYFQNGLSASIVNSGLNIQYLVIGLNQNITYTVRLNGKFMCKMDLSNYPQDYQYCSLEAVSLTQSSSQLMLYWEDFIASSTSYPKFRIRTTFLDDCSRISYSGDFSCRRATLKLVRRVSYYVIRIYAPTFLSVIVTFIGFWIPIMGWPARVAIVVTPLLNLITQDISFNNDINVAYVVSVHWWGIWCQVFVFLALIEYAVAISWVHFINDKKAFKAKQASEHNGIDITELKSHYFGNKGWFFRTGRFFDKILIFFFGYVDYHKDPLMRNKVDYCSRILFPILWIIYCLIYIFATICPWAANYNN